MTRADVLRYGAGGVDVDRLIASRMLIQANSGGGKSRAIRQLLEATHGKVQHLVLDPEGEFATLRERFPYVLAAKTGGDVVATPKVARTLCRKLMELGASAVCDLYDLGIHERREFVRLFLEELMSLPRALWRPLFVVLDEAHVFVPERGAGEAQSTEAVITLCTQGRKRGFCAILATQRIAKLHKDAAAELLNKLVGRTGLDIDLKRAGDELGMGKEERAGLKTLAPGEFFAYGPAIANEVIRVRTGEVLTHHPEAGRVAAAPAAPKELAGVLAALQELPREAEAEARSIDELRKENARLRLEGKRAPAPDPKSTAKVEVRVDQAAIDRAVAKATKAALEVPARYMAGARKNLLQAVKALRSVAELVDGAAALLEPVEAAPTGITTRPVHAVETRPRPVDISTPAVVAHRATAGGDFQALTRPQQRILDAVAWLDSIGVAPAPQVAAAFLADYTAGAGAFNNTKAQLRAFGFVAYEADGLRLTDEGRRHATVPEAPLTNVALQEAVLGKLDGPGRRVLQPLLDAWPEACTKDDVAATAEYTPGAGAFNNACGRLRSLGLADYPAPGMIRATDILFPETA